MIEADHAACEILIVADHGEVLHDDAEGAFQSGGEEVGQEGEDRQEDKATEDGDDLIAGAGAEEQSDGNVHRAHEDQPEVGGEGSAEIGVAVHADEHPVRQRGGQENEEKDESAVEFAQDDVGVGDGGGHQWLDGATAKLFAHEPHGEHGEDEDEDEGHVGQQGSERRLLAGEKGLTTEENAGRWKENVRGSRLTKLGGKLFTRPPDERLMVVLTIVSNERIQNFSTTNATPA